MIAAIHLQEVLALQAVSSVIVLHALFVTGFFAASWAIPDAPTSRTTTALDAPDSFAIALTSRSPDISKQQRPHSARAGEKQLWLRHCGNRSHVRV
jgi:hypothetical protein